MTDPSKRRPSADRNGSRWHILGLPGGILDACRADLDIRSRPGCSRAIILATIRAGRGTDIGMSSLAGHRRILDAYGWVLATHDVR